MRIDLVLANDGLASAVQDAYIDRDARKGHDPPITPRLSST
jgi:exonuclease III